MGPYNQTLHSKIYVRTKVNYSQNKLLIKTQKISYEIWAKLILHFQKKTKKVFFKMFLLKNL